MKETFIMIFSGWYFHGDVPQAPEQYIEELRGGYRAVPHGGGVLRFLPRAPQRPDNRIGNAYMAIAIYLR